MAAQILDGKQIAAAVREEVKAEVAGLKERGITPGLAVVLVGDDPASQVYVRNKHKACEEVGIYSEVHRLPAETTRKNFWTSSNSSTMTAAFMAFWFSSLYPNTSTKKPSSTPSPWKRTSTVSAQPMWAIW